MVGSQPQTVYGVLVKMMIGALVVANLGAAWEEAPTVRGKVLCQACTQGWNEWDSGGKPIKGCKVAITCTGLWGRVVYFGSDETDEEGKYEISIPKVVNGKELKPEQCYVRLFYSPDEACNIPTNSGGGQSGVKLTEPTSVYRDLINFVVGPFYYTTPMCDKPDTTDADDDNQGDTTDADDDDNQGDKY